MRSNKPPSAAARLRARLEELGWSGVDLSEAIGVSTGEVSRWLSEERRPSLEMAFRLERSRVGLPASIWVRGSTHAKAG